MDQRLLKKLLCLLPVPVFVLCCNLAIDPAHLFGGSQYEHGIAELLLRRMHVADLTNYNERLVQKFYVEGVDHRIDIVVIGSSRTMQIRAKFFPGRSFFNSSVSGAFFEDCMAIYQMYRRRSLLPCTIVLGLDPWMFGRVEGDSWKSVESDYREIEAIMTGRSSPADRFALLELLPAKYLELASPSYFQEALRHFLKMRKDRATQIPRTVDYWPTDDMDQEGPVKLSDGSLMYPKAFRCADTAAVRANVFSEVGHLHERWCCAHATRLDDGQVDKIERFISLMRNDGVRVVLFLSPFHPVAYQFMTNSDRFKGVIEAQQLVERLATLNGIQWIGSYNPADVGLTDEDFLDAVHPKDSGVRRLCSSAD